MMTKIDDIARLSPFKNKLVVLYVPTSQIKPYGDSSSRFELFPLGVSAKTVQTTKALTGDLIFKNGAYSFMSVEDLYGRVIMLEDELLRCHIELSSSASLEGGEVPRQRSPSIA